ncbi:MAG: UvrD-helicase domain-containing protein [Nocardioidaceae bacterium]|nr:UvrD-helicase domain-containing protein [Nocardioidaceae bacterium]
MTPFDLLGPLPEPCSTTVLEASAGTGKTYAVGALVTRYVAEGIATLEELLVITFGRAASQELRERVHAQLVDAERALASGDDRGDALLALLLSADRDARRRRVRDALASFDAATIATTHQFCQLVLRSLGVAGDTDARATLVDDLDELVVEVVDDLYLARFGGQESPPLTRAEVLDLARRVVDDPQAELAPAAPEGSRTAERVEIAHDVRRELDRRKRRLGLLSYDDLLSRLAAALDKEGSAARDQMRRRWKFVLVDEFQDTDPVQWQVLDLAFRDHATMVLIGDPKQAIYAFRGGDVVTYLAAAQHGTRSTLAKNWRSDGPLVDALGHLLGGATLGEEILVRPVEAARPGTRLVGAPSPAPVRVRTVAATDLGGDDGDQVPIGKAREHIAKDLADDVALLLSSGATFDGRPLRAGDVAVLMQSLSQVGLFRQALHAKGIASVVSGGSSVLTSEGGDDWLTLLEALEQPHRPLRVRAVALTPFVGLTAAELDAGGDELTDDLAERVRGWLDLIRARGVAAVHEALVADGLTARVLAQADGERRLTDLNHLAQLLHEVGRRERLGLPALVAWLRAERRSVARVDARTRRLDTDAAAVQFTTIHASKGLQYPVVYLPTAFNRWVPPELTTQLFHDGERRLLDVGGDLNKRAVAEAAAEELRLTYVALTRAQSQVVAWLAPTKDSATAGLSRLLLGRRAGEALVPDTITPGGPAADVRAALEAWEQQGALVAEPSTLRRAARVPPEAQATGLRSRVFDRGLDTAWRRTSYSGLIRAEEEQGGPPTESEPEVEGTTDERDELEPGVLRGGVPGTDALADLPSPMDGLPAGAEFGSLVHGVLEHADPQADDLLAELRAQVAEQQRWWSVGVDTETIAASLLPLHHTSLGPLANGLTLAGLSKGDRLCELDFEFPLTGGDRPAPLDVALAAVAGVLRQHLPVEDPMRAYADRLESPALGEQVLRGYLSGSIDVVLRVPDAAAGHRFLIADYKTNRLGEVGKPLTALDYTPRAMTAGMLHSHYPLQALLYSVVLHRYLRWRLPGYDPEQHLGGILYLYLRGMCGPQTPVVDGQPCGVFAWKPPAAMVTELSDLLDGVLP